MMSADQYDVVLHLGFIRFLRAMLGLLAVFATISSAAAATTYDARPVSILSSTIAINERGWIAGQSAFSPDGAALYAGNLRTITPGSAHGLNNDGVVIGEYVPPNTNKKSRAFRSNPSVSADVVNLGALFGGDASAAYAINAAGKVVGYSNAPDPADSTKQIAHAVSFKDGAPPFDLGYFKDYGGVGAYARGINDEGAIVGEFKKSDGTYRPFQIIDGNAHPLNGFEQDNARVISINNNSRIIGNITLNDTRMRAFVYEGGKRTDIVPEGGGESRAYGQNHLGQIVGEYKIANTLNVLETRAFVFESGKFMDLQSLLPSTFTPKFTVAYAINNHGAIVGWTRSGFYLVSPRVITPMVQHPALPWPDLPNTGDDFGSAIAVAGNLAVVGAPGVQNNRGAAYVFRFDGTVWHKEGDLVVRGAEVGLRLGEQVATDGTTIVVTSMARSAAYVFRYSGATWDETAKLEPEITGNTDFGVAVAMSGTRIVVGAPREYVTAFSSYSSGAGAIYVFDWAEAQWTRTRLPAPDPNYEGRFGSAVAAQGDVMAVGEPSVFFTSRARSYIYTYEKNGTWRRQPLNVEYQYLSEFEGFGSSIDLAGDTLVVAGPSAAKIFKRIDSTTGSVWVEQDWISTTPGEWAIKRSIAIDGDAIAVGGASYARIYRRIGRVWDEQRIEPATPLAANALTFRGNMLMFASAAASGGGTVVPITICPEFACAVADLSVTLDAPADALVAERATHTITVRNGDANNTVDYAAIRSEFKTSSGAALDWADAPSGCVALPALNLVDCVVRKLGPNQEIDLKLHVAAPLSGTLTHNVTVSHVGPDPEPNNNSASSTMAVTSNGLSRIEIYTPADLVERNKNEAIDLRFKILNFPVAPNSNYFTVSIDGHDATPYDDARQKISLGSLAEGSHSVTVALMTRNSEQPMATKTVPFSVNITTPSVVINYPAGKPIDCHKGKLIAPQVEIKHWKLGENGKHLLFQIDGRPFGSAITREDEISTVNLCSLTLDATYDLTAVLRDSVGNPETASPRVTFELRKAAPKVEFRQPNDGVDGYARGGFRLDYWFEPGYDEVQLSFELNGSAFSTPPPVAGTNSFPLSQELLRDGPNELVVTVTTNETVLDTMTLRFSTQIQAPDQPKSKGGTIDTLALALLLLLFVRRMLQFPGSLITTRRDSLSRPSST